MKQFVVCITGASGTIYGIRLMQYLSKENIVHLIVSDNGYVVLDRELGIKKSDFIKSLPENVKLYNNKDISAPLASGSRLVETEGVIVAPCSMGTLSSIANGTAGNLIHRVCDVALKERKKLFLLLREMPYSLIHIKNMEQVTLAGGIVSSASPGFYHHPKTVEDMINFIVGKILDSLGIDHSLYKKWMKGEKINENI